MKIKSVYQSFTDLVDIGRHALFIEVDMKGAYQTNADLVEQAKHFHMIVIKGDEPFNQKTEISDFAKKYFKQNPFGHIQIITNGTIRPIGLNSQKSITYITQVNLKNSGIDYSKRVDEKALKWFKDAGAYFVFRCDDEDALDEVSLIVSAVEIRKPQVFIIPTGENVTDFCMKVKVRKFNITFEVGSTIWGDTNDEEGRTPGESEAITY